jgi:hypothetical protein
MKSTDVGPEELFEAGAEVDASDGLAIYAALAHGERKASRALCHHGARLDLRFAAGLGEIGVMESFLTAAGTLKTDARRSHSRRPYCERNVGVTKDSAPDADTSELPRMTDSEILAEALDYAMVNSMLELMPTTTILNPRGRHPCNGPSTMVSRRLSPCCWSAPMAPPLIMCTTLSSVWHTTTPNSEHDGLP